MYIGNQKKCDQFGPEVSYGINKNIVYKFRTSIHFFTIASFDTLVSFSLITEISLTTKPNRIITIIPEPCKKALPATDSMKINKMIIKPILWRCTA